ncbi:GGDEF domain-containing protein [Colwellia hornerae]|uniref:diguanylate cyclase n=1 Tax=Colwellia hornerae TaxID=89402 RepID=A0A5C6QR08_9GAMM|nr:GGDEF domain-containing protein [Colwellia hornerae]TWX57655.1 GGDEF domain-containing protein [Colwellia hornerae]TWX62614.1 GGDEF domain-containing protein [Colwellia hornerae]TWX71525.1 GGDEF domain-containing protein [Colwellia hornerae]
MDLRRRSMTGIVVYAVMLPAVFWPFDFHTEEPTLSLAFAVIMLTISVVRLAHWFFSDAIYNYSPNLWRNGFTILSLLHASVLSLFFGLAIYDPRFTPILHVTMLAIGGIASSAIVALTPRISLALLNLGMLLVPSIIAGFIIDNKLPYALMILVYVVFIGLMGVRSSREYNRSFEIETQLDGQKKILEQLNKVDVLTNIYNRGYFNSEFERQWQMGSRHKISTALMLIDVDHFKVFNDHHGHLCGDACLIHVANLMKRHIKRTTDLVARFGGEEFVVLLSGYSGKDAITLAEKIRLSIESTPFNYEGNELYVTISIGVASTIPDSQSDKKILLEAADKAMYNAKRAGRNQVFSTIELLN